MAEGDHLRRANTAFRVTMQTHDIPANSNWPCEESTHGDKTRSRVLCLKMVLHGHEDGQASNCERKFKGDERKAEA